MKNYRVKNLWVVGLLVTFAALADASLSVETLTLRDSNTSNFYKIEDSQEKRVCYVANTSTGGAVAMSCYDTKPEVPKKSKAEEPGK